MNYSNTSIHLGLAVAYPQWQTLAAQLAQFEVKTSGTGPLTFKTRLAREHNWTQTYTERVWFEYKRFLLMLAITDRFICPCEEVDQIWHAHLIYTESYWLELCGNLIGKPLHHIPASGGQTATKSFLADYAYTLLFYESLFGEKPPKDIWPLPQNRLKDTPHLRLINSRTHFTIKRSLPKAIAIFLAFIGIIFLYPSDAMTAQSLEKDNEYIVSEFASNLFNLIFFIGIFILINTLFGGLIAAIKSLFNTHKCPVCDKKHAFYKTHAVSSDHSGMHEYRCIECGHHDWYEAGDSNDGGCGGSGGGCGGSGGGG